MNGFEIEFDGRKIEAQPGQTLAEALLANGVLVTRRTAAGAPRGVFCGMGVCYECRAKVNGRPNVRTCRTLAQLGDRVETQDDARLSLDGPAAESTGEAV